MAQTAQVNQRSEVRDGMRVDWHVPIPMDDGVVLRADVYRPDDDKRHPVIMTHGPYAKGLSFQEAYASSWNKMIADYPEIGQGSNLKYMNWEVVDPEKWVPGGYACVRVDSRGAGWSPGYLDLWSERENKDYATCIEWAGQQPWSNGKVGLNGISYYAMNQWHVAGLKPKHLAAICVWEGAADSYRDMNYHGGILCKFAENWYPRQIATIQYGLGERAKKSPNTGESVAGPVTLSEEELKRNRSDYVAEVAAHRFDDEWHRVRSAHWDKIEVPLLSSANWGGQGLHPRGNFEGFINAASKQKWLEVHGDTHFSPFYSDYGLKLQKRFFGHFLKGDNTGWDKQPPVVLQVRHIDRFVERAENEWPLARTQWTKFYLDPAARSLVTSPIGKQSQVEYGASSDGVDFSFTLPKQMEITGPIAARLFISSSSNDADLFLVVRVFDPHNDEITFQGALDPNTPIGQGWLRVSHRRLDFEQSLPWRPYHSHDRVEPMTPGQVYEVEVEVIPTSIVIPAGYRLVLTVRGKDYSYDGPLSDFARSFYYASRGIGPFNHEKATSGKVTLYADAGRDAYLLLPVIPA